jgi:hypothetical protein
VIGESNCECGCDPNAAVCICPSGKYLDRKSCTCKCIPGVCSNGLIFNVDSCECQKIWMKLM